MDSMKADFSAVTIYLDDLIIKIFPFKTRNQIFRLSNKRPSM
uniref:Mobile element protein n=1 Tax=Heterorhabditis bacteriophora TaxID=37862 RepID=A0A1I7WV39_HETBA